MEFFAKSCVMPIVSFDTSFTIIQLLLLPDFKKESKVCIVTKLTVKFQFSPDLKY